MAHVFQSFNRAGKPHPKYRFRYIDHLGRRRTCTGTTSRTQTQKMADAVEFREKEIRAGLRAAPKTSDDLRPIDDAFAEYIAWGETQGGRNGFGWSTVHRNSRETRLKWWKTWLGLEYVRDLENILARVEKGLQDMQRRKKSGKTLAGYAEALKAFCNWCQNRDYLDKDPLRHLGRINTTPLTQRRAATVEEIQALLAVCPEKRRLLYEVAFSSGLRAGELAALRVEHLDRSAGGLHLEARWTKNRRAGFQPLPARIVAKLVASTHGKAPTDPLLEVPTHPAREMELDMEAAGVPKWRPGLGKIDFHAIRVAYVSFVLDSGASVKEAQTLARHLTPGLTMNTYARTRQDRLSEVAEKVGDMLDFTGRGVVGGQAGRASGATITAVGNALALVPVRPDAAAAARSEPISDGALANVIAQWDSIPKDLRTGILAMVRAAGSK